MASLHELMCHATNLPFTQRERVPLTCARPRACDGQTDIGFRVTRGCSFQVVDEVSVQQVRPDRLVLKIQNSRSRNVG